MKMCDKCLRKDGKICYIKEPIFEELNYVEKLWGDIKTTEDIGGPFVLTNKVEFFEKMVSPGNGLNKYFLIYDKENNPVGEVSFRKNAIDSKTAMFNLKVEFLYRGKGYGKEAMDLILDYYFNGYGGEIMEDDIAINNTRAQKIFVKYGFDHVPTYNNSYLVRLNKEKFNFMKERELVFKGEDIERFLVKWKEILRLRDWDIKYEMVLKEWRKTGDIKIDRDDKKAVLMVNNFNPKQDNIEALIVHELLHLKLWDMDQMIEGLVYDVFGEDEKDPKLEFAYGQFMTTLESTVEDLAKGYMAVGGEDAETSFGRIQKEVDKEKGNVVKE